MNVQLILNWKSFAAIGLSAAVVTLAVKVDPLDARDALASVANAITGVARIGDSEMQ